VLARRLTTTLPAMRLTEALETTRMHRVTGLTGARTAFVTTRPCRAPPHTIAVGGLIGAARCRGRGRCRWRTMAFCTWMNCRSSAATSWRFCANRLRKVSQEYNFPRVLDLNRFAGLQRFSLRCRAPVHAKHQPAKENTRLAPYICLGTALAVRVMSVRDVAKFFARRLFGV
jgi:hypothetical protein